MVRAQRPLLFCKQFVKIATGAQINQFFTDKTIDFCRDFGYNILVPEREEQNKKRKVTAQTRKGIIMTKKEALSLAINAINVCNETDQTVIDTLKKMLDQLDKPRAGISDEKKAAINAVRKEKTAQARHELVEKIIPILRATITTDMTAKEIYEAAKDKLPEDFSANKVQNILLREMAPELVKTEAKGKANTYRII